MMAQLILLQVGIVVGVICCDVRECSWMCRGDLRLCCFGNACQWRFCFCEGGITSTSLECKHSGIRTTNGISSSSQAPSIVLS